MKKIIIIVFILVVISLAIALVVSGYRNSDFSDIRTTQQPETPIETTGQIETTKQIETTEQTNATEQYETEPVFSVPESLILDIDSDPESSKTLYYSKPARLIDKEIYCYSESGEEGFYLYDESGSFVGWRSDPDVDPTMNESLIKISKDPSAGISDEEAVAVAYDHAAALYGDAIRTFDLAEVSGDAYQAFVILEKTYSAADFTAHGPRCSVRVLRDGSLDFCTCGKTENVNEDALSLVTLEDVDSFVREEIAERFGDAVVGYEVWDRKAAVNDAGQTVLLLGVYCFFSETPSAELIERYGLGGSWGTDNRYGCTLEYVVG